MTIENLKQIAIKYASTKGSRLPLAPDELCNAVVQYMNSFFGVMTDINTIKVAVTEDSGNIVFTITGNTYDGKPITPIVITVDHNDFVTDQEFEAFKTTTNAAIQKNTESINSLSFRVEDTENDITTIQVQVGQINTRVGNTETNIAKINSTLDNKLDKVVSSSNFNRLYKISDSGVQGVVNYSDEAYASTIVLRDGLGAINIAKGSTKLNAANMENIADVEAKIPDVSKFATKDEIPEYTSVDSVIYDTTNGAIIAYDGAHEIHIPLQAGENVTIAASEDNKKIVISAAGGGGTGDVTAAGNNTFTGENTFTNEITFNTMKSEAGGITFGNFEGITEDGYNYSGLNDYQFIMQKFVGTDDYYETLINADLITYKPAGNNNVYKFHFPNKSGIFALTSDVPNSNTLAKLGEDNTYTGTNTFNNSIYAKNGIVAGDTTNYGANSVTKGSNTYSFPNKSGTFAMTTDVIKTPIYFISFYANAPSEPCHLIGTIMSKNSYGTGQKTNEEFAVMLADNLYTNSNEGLAAYGKLANKDILCIYSEDGLSIRCLDEENSEVDLPTIMFFVMETEL